MSDSPGTSDSTSSRAAIKLRRYGMSLVMGVVTMLALYQQQWDLAIAAFSATCGWALADHYKWRSRQAPDAFRQAVDRGDYTEAFRIAREQEIE